MEQAPHGYQGDRTKVYETTVDQALRWLVPDAHGRKLVALFDGRVTRATIANWRAGRRSIPQWAIDRIDQLTRERSRAVTAIKPGPGKSAIGFARWRARRERSDSR